MAKVLLTKAFLEELSFAPQPVEDAVWASLSTIEKFPGVGSALLEPFLKRVYGPDCLKVAVCGFDLLYRRMDETDEILALGLIHQKRVR